MLIAPPTDEIGGRGLPYPTVATTAGKAASKPKIRDGHGGIARPQVGEVKVPIECRHVRTR
jgi:hypothetical protein